MRSPYKPAARRCGHESYAGFHAMIQRAIIGDGVHTSCFGEISTHLSAPLFLLRTNWAGASHMVCFCNTEGTAGTPPQALV